VNIYKPCNIMVTSDMRCKSVK